MVDYHIGQAIITQSADGNVLNISKSCTSNEDIFANLNEKGNWRIGGNIVTQENKSISYKIYQVGIQSLPGLKFSINDNATEKNGAIILGQTGIFELNLHAATPIESIQFQNIIQLLTESGSALYKKASGDFKKGTYYKITSSGVYEFVDIDEETYNKSLNNNGESDKYYTRESNASETVPTIYSTKYLIVDLVYTVIANEGGAQV